MRERALSVRRLFGSDYVCYTLAQMTIAHIFKRPAMYIGTGFETLDEFRIFMATLAFFGAKNFSAEEDLAIRSLSEFVVRHYYGAFENRSWAEELMKDSEDDVSAIYAGMIFVLELAEMFRSKGRERLDEIFDAAPDFKLVSSDVRLSRLEELIDRSIQLVEQTNDLRA